MNEAIRITGVEKVDLSVYGMYQELSAMPVKDIERLRKKIQAEIEAEKNRFDNVGNVHEFIDLLMDTCIKAAKEKSHQEGSYTEPSLVAEVIESLPQQDDCISFAI